MALLTYMKYNQFYESVWSSISWKVGPATQNSNRIESLILSLIQKTPLHPWDCTLPSLVQKLKSKNHVSLHTDFSAQNKQ